MPRPDEEPVGPDERFDSPEVSGAFLEIVLDRDGLSVEGERAKVGVALEDVQEARDHRNEAGAVSLEPLVPLAVPVRVRDHEGAPAEASPDAREHDRAGRGDPSTVQPTRAEEKEREDPPEEAVPVQIGEGNGDGRGREIPLRGDREVELRVGVAERGEKVVQRERRWRQMKTPTPRTTRPTTM